MRKFIPIKDRIEYGGAMIGQEEVNAIMKVITSQGGKRWTIGPESVALEKELAQVAGVKRAILTNSGSSALLIGIASLNLPKNSKVIIPAVTFPTAFNSIVQNNLMPLVVDVDIKTLNLSFVQVEKAFKKYKNSISAVLAVDIAGNPVDLIALRKITKAYGAKIILDDCDGFGTFLRGSLIERYADVSVVSFHAAHIITMGEGGAVLTDNVSVADKASKFREWGRASGSDKIYHYKELPKDYKERYVFEEIGYNLKPLELQCAMGRIQLKKLALFREKRSKNYKKLEKIFNKYKEFFSIVSAIKNSTPCWFSFPFLCRKISREKAMRVFEENNIETRTIFAGNILKHPAYKNTNYIQFGNLNNANDVLENGMFISCHPSINNDMISFIEKTVKGLIS